MDKTAVLEIRYVISTKGTSCLYFHTLSLKSLYQKFARVLASIAFVCVLMNVMTQVLFPVLLCRWIQAFTERSFFEFVDNKTICYSCAARICFLNLETRLQSVFQSPVREIGALAANGNKRIFAFAEQKRSSSIFVYNFPEFQLKSELKGKVVKSVLHVDAFNSYGRIW